MNIEEKILGGILIEPSIMDEEGVADFLEEKWFNHPYDTIFKLISSVYEQNLPIDTVSIFEESQKKGYNISPAFITEMTSKVFSGANVPYHAKVLYEQYLRRESLRTFEEDQKKVVDGEDIFDVIDLHTQKMMDLTTTKTDHGSEVNVTLKSVVEHIERVHSGNTDGMWVETGFYDLDEKLKMMNGELIILAARPSMGKTAFALNCNRNISENYWTGLNSLEMQKFQLTTRLLSTESGIPYLSLVTGKLKSEDGSILSRASHKISKLKLYIDDQSAINPMQLRSKAMRMKKKYGITSLWVDYLQLMRATEYGSDRTREVGYISRSLKGLAKDLNIPVIALAQLNRGVEGRNSKIPQLSDLRESGEIEQDADNVLFLYRPEYYGIMQLEDGTPTENLCIINIAKNRNGATGEIKLKFNKNIMKFENLSHNFNN